MVSLVSLCIPKVDDPVGAVGYAEAWQWICSAPGFLSDLELNYPRALESGKIKHRKDGRRCATPIFVIG